MDTCHYCGTQYHPMPVWIRPGERIRVCQGHPEITDEGVAWKQTDCQEKAKVEGYTQRLDLTPKR